MPRIYPDFENPTMIYNSRNEYTIIDAADAPSLIAAGWSPTPLGDINTSPSEFTGDVEMPADAPAPNLKKKAKPQPVQDDE